MAFTSDTFCTTVGSEEEGLFTVNLWMRSNGEKNGCARMKVTELDSNYSEGDSFFIDLDAGDLTRLMGAFQEAIDMMGGGE